MSNNTNNTNSIPGMVYPTQKAMLAGTPRESALAQGNLTTQKLASLNKIGGKTKSKRVRKMRSKWGGATSNASGNGTIVIPQFNMAYTPTGGPRQDPNSIIQQNAANSTQGAANAVYDKYASQMGGVYMNMNTNPYQWGCYSGGKKTRKNRRNNRRKKSTKRRRSSRRK